jgi:hypothetical protein
MTTNILPPIAQSPIEDQNYFRRYAPGFVPDGPADIHDHPSATPPAPPPVPSRFINHLCLGAAIFGALVFSVVREIQHSHELYRMSQVVAASEAQAREFRDQFRLSRAREATLEAKLQVQESRAYSAQPAKTDDPPPR